MTGTPPLRVELRGSAALTGLALAVHMAAGCIVVVVLPMLAAILALGLLAFLAISAVREKTFHVAPHAPAALYLGYDGGLILRLRDGGEATATVAARRYVGRWLVVLDLEGGAGGRRTMLVARDMLAPEAFRLLRLWALWGTLPRPRGGEGARSPSKRTISTDTCL